MTEIEVTSWIPVRKLIRFEPSYPEDFHECLEQFRASLKFVLAKLSPTISAVDARILAPTKTVSRDLQQLNLGYIPTSAFEFIKVTCVIEYDKTAIQDANPNRPITDNDLSGFAACELSSVFADVLLLAQLSFPARIKSAVGRTYVGLHPMNHISSVSGVPYEAICLSDLKWPPVAVLPLVQIVEWEARLGLFQSGVGKTPVQRALASFTHLASLSSVDEGETLFWSMQGLEAFYCKGTGDLRRQLSEKSRLFLGEWDDKKNVVGYLYDFRSRFVHGDVNLVRWNNNMELPQEGQDDAEASYSAMRLASRMLLATLQKCATENIVSAEFGYTLNITRG